MILTTFNFMELITDLIKIYTITQQNVININPHLIIFILKIKVWHLYIIHNIWLMICVICIDSKYLTNKNCNEIKTYRVERELITKHDLTITIMSLSFRARGQQCFFLSVLKWLNKRLYELQIYLCFRCNKF